MKVRSSNTTQPTKAGFSVETKTLTARRRKQVVYDPGLQTKVAGEIKGMTVKQGAAYSPTAVPSIQVGEAVGIFPTSKQGMVLDILQRPDGATVDEIAAATGWQRHSVRGFLSGTVKKKLGLAVSSVVSDRGRVYRLEEAA